MWRRTSEVGPYWCGAVSTASHGAVSPQCPQGIGLLTLPVLQGAAVPSEHLSQFVPAASVAELRSSPSLQRSLEQLDWLSPASAPLQGTDLAAPITPDISLERLIPLVDYLAVWNILPNVSRWVSNSALHCCASAVSFLRWLAPSSLWLWIRK